MLIVNPSFGISATGGERKLGGPVDWRSDPIALLSNSKPNARELLEGVKERMGAFRDIGNIEYLYKQSASQPAPAALIEQVAGTHKAALLALAD
ncbi:MAG: hypothetical protein KDK91_31405 [Gammaproteobacteria bacterium]|nr:hypothetical protein [Gammaproteobacteria bacterium]